MNATVAEARATYEDLNARFLAGRPHLHAKVAVAREMLAAAEELAAAEAAASGAYQVVYSAEDGAESVGTPTTLEEASRIAGEMVYRLTGDDWAGFPIAADTYPVRAADGTNHTVRVVPAEPTATPLG